MAKGGPEYPAQATKSRSRRERARVTFGDDTMGEDLLARCRRDIHDFPSTDWQEREDSAEPYPPRAPEWAWTAGIPPWRPTKD